MALARIKSAYFQLRPLPESTFAWYDVHFPVSSFNGRINVGRRRDDGYGVLRLYMSDRAAVRGFLEEMHVSQKLDYYITANTVSGVDRRLEDLFSLNNIVIDVDCHSEDSEATVEGLLWRIRRDMPFPTPNSFVQTGRGLQLWWSLVPLHSKCRPYYEEVRDYFMKRLSSLIDEYPDELDGFTVDSSASRNLVGYYRLPGTVNTKTGTEVMMELVREEPYLLQDLEKWVWAEKKAEKTKAKPKQAMSQPYQAEDPFSGQYKASDVRLLRGYHTLGFFRMRQLIQLRLLRDEQIGEETRNNLCFIAYNAMLPALGHDKAYEKLQQFNAGFKKPMEEKELEAVICSAKDKGGYRYSNKKLIEFLEITPEEQRRIGLFEPTEEFSPMVAISLNPSRDAARRLQRSDRDEKILRLAKTGLKKRAIAESLGIDRETVASVLKREGFDRNALIAQLLDDGLSVTEICERLHLSRPTVKKIENEKSVEKRLYI